MSETPEIRAALDPGDSVLILADDFDVEREVCGALLDWTAPGDTAFLAITLTHSPSDRLELWEEEVAATLPARAGIITGVEMGGGPIDADSPAAASEIRVESVSDPADLTGVGIGMTELLENWHGGAQQIVGCFHSVTTLLQYAEEERAFRFLHMFTSRLAEVNGLVHYHMDPGAHDEQTMHRFEQLFDAVVDTTVKGTETEGWEVRHR